MQLRLVINNIINKMMTYLQILHFQVTPSAMLLAQYFTGSMWFCATLLLASASTSWLLPLKPEKDVTQVRG